MKQTQDRTDPSAPRREPAAGPGSGESITPARRSYRWLIGLMIIAPLAVAVIAFAVRAWRSYAG